MVGFCVALIYNLKGNVPLEPGAPPDALAEYDSLETVQALEDALLAGDHRVISLERTSPRLSRSSASKRLIK